MPYTEVNGRQQWVPLDRGMYPAGRPRRLGADQVDPARQAAFAAEGLRRRAALRARGVPGIPAVQGGMVGDPIPAVAGPLVNKPVVDPYAQQRQAAMQPTSFGTVQPVSPELSLRSLAASKGIPVAPSVPLEQQGFARGQGVNPMGMQTGVVSGGGPLYGQTQGDGGQPTDVYGLRRPLGTGNIQPTPGSGVIGTLPGGSIVANIGGRRVVMGQGVASDAMGMLNAQGPAGMSSVLRMGQRSADRQNAERAALMAEQNPNATAQPTLRERQNALRYEFQKNKPGQRLSDSYLRGKYQIPMTPTTPTSPAKPITSDEALNRLGRQSQEPGAWRHTPLAGPLAGASGREIIEAINSPGYNARSEDEKKGMHDDLSHWLKTMDDYIAKYPGKPLPETAPYLPELRARANGDKKAEDAARAKRIEDEQDAEFKRSGGMRGKLRGSK